MDPVTVKFVQLLLAEVLGAVLCLAGVFLFLRGVSGKSSLVVEGAGLKAKLTNAAPGGLIAFIGLIVLVLSLNSTVERTERVSSTPSTAKVLELWLANSFKVTDEMNYGQVIDTIVGADPNIRFTSRSKELDAETTLGDLAVSEYRDSKYWRLIAAINKDRGYFSLKDAAAESKVPANGFIESWHVSVFNGMDIETRTRVADANRAAGYDQLLALATSGTEFAIVSNSLTDRFRTQELDLAFVIANTDEVRSLRELSLKYYRDPKYWPVIVWVNKDQFPAETREDAPVPTDKPLTIPVFIGWPR